MCAGFAGCGSRKAKVDTIGTGSGSDTTTALCEPVPVTQTFYLFELQGVRLFASNTRFVLSLPLGGCPGGLGVLPDLAAKIGDCLTCGTPVDAQQIAALEAEIAKGKIDVLMPGTDPIARVTLSDREVLFWDRVPIGGAGGVGAGQPAVTSSAAPSPMDTARPISQFFAAVQRGNVCAPCQPPNDCETGPGGGRIYGLGSYTTSTCDPSCEQLRAQYCPMTDGGRSAPLDGYKDCTCAETCCLQP